MKEISVSGQKRATTGKKASKEMRKEGLVPCNLYGEKKGENGAPEALAFAIPAAQPVKLVGHAQGVRDGGRLSQAVRTLNVTAPYKQIPEVLNVDVTELKLGKAIKVAELNFDGLQIATPAQVVVCSVKATRASRSAAAAEANQ